MILGISASGRTNGITSETVKAILEATGSEYEFISLAGKQISGCIGCTKCASDNKCKLKDDWLEIAEKMLAADAIVFGAPNYHGYMNALGHACLERTFCFRHREVFNMAGKLGVIVSVDYFGDSAVHTHIKDMMLSNMMSVVDSVQAQGYSQCYTCGYGIGCAAGRIVKTHGFIETLEEQHFPLRLEKQEKTLFQVRRAGQTLGSILSNRE